MGPEIDGHDTVIRVNSLAGPKFFQDFGKKTDIYFAELMLLRQCTSYRDQLLGGGDASRCFFQGSERCKYDTFILNGMTSHPRCLNLSYIKFPRDDPKCHVTCKAPGLVCGEQAQEIHLAVSLLPFTQGAMPTAGFQAFFTFAPLCQSMRLYGFGGGGNADHHFQNTKTHNYTAEHVFYDRLIAGGVGDEEWRPRRTDLQGVVKWLRLHLTSRARSGSITVVKQKGRPLPR